MVQMDRGAIPLQLGSSAPSRVSLVGFEDFFRSRYTELLRVAMYAGASADEADEAAQQTMIEVYRNWLTIREPWRWARRAVVNNYIKVKQRDAERMPRAARGGHVTPLGADDVGLTVWEDSQWVSWLLGRLPAAQREVMTFIVEGWQPCQVALLLGKTPTAVRQNLKLARDRLRREIEREHDEQVAPPQGRPARTGKAAR